MSTTPTRFPSGISTFPMKNVMHDFPTLPTAYQVVKTDDFLPYRTGDYTATTAGTGATSAAYSWNTGVVKLTQGTTSTFKSLLSTGVNSFMMVPGNNFWHDVRVAVPVTANSASNPAQDSAVYCGLFDTADPTTAANGIYFVKPSGSSAINFVILKNGTATTFSNIGDFQYPSGMYADPTGVNGTLSFTTAATYTNVAITNAGLGYRVAPLIVPTGASGSGAQVYVQLGSSASNPTIGGQGVRSSLYAAYITAPGSGYTGTLAAEVYPWINLQFWYNGKDRLVVGICGREVMALDRNSQNTASPGSTYNVGASQILNYNFIGTTLTAGSYTVSPPPGDVYDALPQVPMQEVFGLVGTTANARVMYVDGLNIAAELN